MNAYLKTSVGIHFAVVECEQFHVDGAVHVFHLYIYIDISISICVHTYDIILVRICIFPSELTSP